MLKIVLRWLLTLLYRVEINGLDNFRKAGRRVLIVANHTSFLDPLLLGVFLPDDITFAINTHISERWWLKPFLGLSKVFPMDPTHPISLKNLIHHLQTDTKTVIFPEGRITVTGSLMKIYDGTGMVADKSGATLLPVRIDGGQYTPFSRLHGVFRLRWFPKIRIHIMPPTHIEQHPELSGKNRRKHSGHILSDIMTDMMFKTSRYQQPIFQKLLEAREIHGGSHVVTEDLDRSQLTYNTLIIRTLAVGKALKKLTVEQEHVGVFLPNSSKTLCVILGLQLHQRIPAMLNYSTGSAGMIAACQLAKVKTVLTSRRFIELGKLDAEAHALSQNVNLVYLEGFAQQITRRDKLIAAIQSRTTRLWYQPRHTSDSPAVVLFTSGSEGTPKGVVLSHNNILANHSQIATRISFNPQDKVLNFLPMFHSFGFTVGTLLPVLNGMNTFFYPTPLHFSVIPEIAYETKATIMFGTNTFLAAYGKKAHAYDFFNLRYVVAGAEKLQDSTRELWAEKFGIRILEGYGATETAPVTAVNTPIDCKTGSVGRFMPAMSHRLEPVEGIENAGKLHVNGPNVMLGYLLADNPGQLTPTESIYGKGWYDTGDIVAVDVDGFISIKGRSKRFAKVGGEMVSLTLLEQIAAKTWPGAHHAVVSLQDVKKGEQIVLLTTYKSASSQDFAANATGLAQICLPRKIIVVDAIPVMATGKINYIAATELAAARI